MDKKKDAEFLKQNSKMLLREGQNKMYCIHIILHIGMVLVKSARIAENRKREITKGHTGYLNVMQS